MKKLSILILLFTGMANAQIVNIPDANFKAALIEFGVDTNSDGNIQESEALNTTTLGLSGQPLITSLEGISSFTNLTNFGLSNLPQLTSLDLSSLSNLEVINLWELPILTSLNLVGVVSLTQLTFVKVPNITSLDLSGYTNLTDLTFNDTTTETSTNLTSLNITGCTALKNLSIFFTSLATLDVSTCMALETFNYGDNFVPNLDLSGLIHLQSITASSNTESISLQSLNANGCIALTNLDIRYNTQLKSIYIKNGTNEVFSLSNFYTPNLTFICADDSQIAAIQTQLNTAGMTTTVCSSYCTFIPGGNYNTITGNATFDANNNGCDALDTQHPNIKVTLNDNTVQGSTFTNSNGTYSFFTQAGNFTITPSIENPTWYTISPTTATIPFANNNNNTTTQNFCLTANGVHNDIEVVIAPIGSARPGFDSHYKIVFKNKGNQTLSGVINLVFDDTRTDFVSATPIVDNIAINSLSWNFTALQPFESREINLILNINSPLETPAVNSGDILSFTTTINPITGDEFPLDNVFTINQTVVNSFDPNDITCLEGETVAPSEIGNYLHYVARFENLGTFQAENVVVKVIVDTNKYDINSLQLLNTSHPSYTRISGNTVEFIFEDINLAAASGNPPVGGHGDVLFKIRTKATLVTNDTVLQRAGIYFDYNFPVITNDAETTFVALSNPIFEFDTSVVVSPNPTTSKINITSDFNIQSVELYDIQGRILSTSIENANEIVLDISNKQNGVYFLRINTESGSKVEKIVKE